jgi:hypothetical protein
MSGIATAAIGSAVIGGVVANSASKRQSDAQDRALEANAYQGEIAKDQYADYKTTYQPLEHQLVADATNYDTKATRDKAAADAQSTVSTQLGLATDRLRRTPGLDPSSAAAQAAQTDLALKGAAMGANAQNAARKQVDDLAYARKLDAVGLGKGLVSGATSALGSAAANAQASANAQGAIAAQTASGVGGVANTAIKALSNVNWGTSSSPSSLYTGNSWADSYTPDASPMAVNPSVGAVIDTI